MSTKSQNAQLLALLVEGYELTPLDALDRIGTLRLAARVHDLRADGHDIRGRWKKVGGKRFKAYSLFRD